MNTNPQQFYIAGVQHRPKSVLDNVQQYLEPRTNLLDAEVKLIGEPKNQFDRYAVKITIGGYHIGYVPKPINIDIWALRDADWKPNVRLVSYHPNAALWRMFFVEVSFIRTELATKTE